MLNYDNTGVTVELGEIVESGVDIWAFDYPVPAKTVTYNGKTAPVPFDKDKFQQKILDHYRFRQIGQETVGRWLHYFRTRIKEIMPYYVQLYEFEAKWFNVDDPLESYNLTETFDQESSGSGSSSYTNTANTTTTSERETEHSGSTETAFSDTPQGSLNNVISGEYLTNATVVSDGGSDYETGSDNATSDTTGSNASEDSGTVKHTLTRRGNIGVQPLGTEVTNIRDAFINIDLMVINELKDLFLQVY